MKSAPKLKAVSKLHFDLQNPRYGVRSAIVKDEAQALNMIVDEFGVDDLLNSITSNGFFGGEPLIVTQREDGEFDVLEGNRRLATLLILNSDPRASQQKKRGESFIKKAEEGGVSIPKQVPVLIVDKGESANIDKDILAYLGTKHIVGPSEWDSYAKARWMAEMEEKTGLSLSQIKSMIGDTGRLVEQMLQGYYVVEQLKDAGHFNPEQSYVGGRGSNPSFPFSWVYTALSLRNIQRFIGVEDTPTITKNPIKPENLDNAGDLMVMMFGDKSRQREPVIEESRDLGDLSRALVNPAKSAMLKNGEKLHVVEEKSRPISDQLGILIIETLERITKANGLLSQGVTAEVAAQFQEQAKKISKAAKAFEIGLYNLQRPEEDHE